MTEKEWVHIEINIRKRACILAYINEKLNVESHLEIGEKSDTFVIRFERKHGEKKSHSIC